MRVQSLVIYYVRFRVYSGECFYFPKWFIERDEALERAKAISETVGNQAWVDAVNLDIPGEPASFRISPDALFGDRTLTLAERAELERQDKLSS